MSRQPRIAIWFSAVFMLFFARAFMFSTWVSRGSDVFHHLDVGTFEFGVLTMLYPLAGMLAINFAAHLVRRLGSRTVAFAMYGIGAVSLGLLGFAIESGSFLLTGLLLMLIGGPMAIIDFVSNYEGNLADKASRHSLFAAMHGAYGLGFMSGSAIAGSVSDLGLSLSEHYLWIAVVAGIASVGAGLSLPKHELEELTDEQRASARRQGWQVWTERRSLTIAVVGFAFIMAEMSASTWVPIALPERGFSASAAAFALSLFWAAITVVRLLGGFVVDKIGRYRTVLVSAVVAAIGIGEFMVVDGTFLPYIGLILWGSGMALGFPMSISSMGDDPARAAARINMIIAVVYIASLTVGPALGAVGQSFGIYTAFGIPLVMLIVSAALSGATKPLVLISKAD